MSLETAVTVKNLLVAFGKFKAVNDVSFEVTKGEIFGFLGANGAGKTTTIRVLCGLIPPTGGSVLVAGADPAIDPQRVKSNVGYMSQKFTLYRDMTIFENLQFSGNLRKMTNEKIADRIKELTNFIGLDWPMNTMVKDLPAGVLQQIALVSATIHDPQIVFLDEPTAGVTPQARSRFWELINTLSSAGKTVFVTTHYMDEAEQCDRIALMRSGELIALGSPAELKESTFPEPMFEITPPDGAKAGWKDMLKKEPFLEELQIFGMRYHARVSSSANFEKFLRTNMPDFQYQSIKPSLEDVFIRLVEGKNR